MQVVVATRTRQGPAYGAWLPDPPKHGWWRVIFVAFTCVHSICVIPFLVNISIPIKSSEEEKELIWLLLCIMFYFLYALLSWIASIRCDYRILYVLCYATPVIVTCFFVYAGSKGYFVYKNSWKDQFIVSTILSAFIMCTILRYICAIEGGGTISVVRL